VKKGPTRKRGKSPGKLVRETERQAKKGGRSAEGVCEINRGGLVKASYHGW